MPFTLERFPTGPSKKVRVGHAGQFPAQTLPKGHTNLSLHNNDIHEHIVDDCHDPQLQNSGLTNNISCGGSNQFSTLQKSGLTNYISFGGSSQNVKSHLQSALDHDSLTRDGYFSMGGTEELVPDQHDTRNA